MSDTGRDVNRTAEPVTSTAKEQSASDHPLVRLQRAAGNQAVSAYVQMQRTAERTTYDRLVEASQGNWIGDVDEGRCLELLRALSAPEKQRAVGDSGLLGRLADALDYGEMVQLCDILPLTLSQRVYWMWKADEIGSLEVTVVHRWLTAAPEGHVTDFLGRATLVDTVSQRLPLPPRRSLGATFPGPAMCALYARYPGMAKWLGRTAADLVFFEIGQTGATDDQVRGARQRLLDVGVWNNLRGALSKGAAETTPLRRALRRIAGLVDAEAAPLFAIRFNHPLTGTWDVRDIRGVWDQLETLPDSDVSSNTVIRSFRAITGDRGFWSSGHIELGAGLRTSAQGAQRLPHTVRHEVGHAVHDRLEGTVNSWLRQGVGFWYYPSGGRSGVDAVITDFGGYPATYTDMSNASVPFTAADRTLIRNMLVNHVNVSSSWTAATNLPVAGSVVRNRAAPTAQQKLVLLWEAMPAGLQLAFSNSTNRWYRNYATHPSGARGFTFWNHWYAKPFYFSPTALAAINATGDDYSAMSEKEFFANCYAEFFEDPAGAADPRRWGGSLNAPIQAFFRTHILNRQPYQFVAGAGAGASLPPSPHGVPRG